MNAVPIDIIGYPITLCFDGRSMIIRNKGELLSVLEVYTGGEELVEVSGKESMTSSSYSNLSGYLSSHRIIWRRCGFIAQSEFERFLIYTNKILPLIQGVGRVTVAKIKTLDPQINYVRDFKYPVECKFDDVTVLVHNAAEFSSKLFDGYKQQVSFEFHGYKQCISVKPQKVNRISYSRYAYPDELRAIFRTYGIVSITDFLRFTHGLVPRLNRLTDARFKELKAIRDDVRFAPDLNYPLCCILPGEVPKIIHNTTQLSDLLVNSYLQGYKSISISV